MCCPASHSHGWRNNSRAARWGIWLIDSVPSENFREARRAISLGAANQRRRQLLLSRSLHGLSRIHNSESQCPWFDPGPNWPDPQKKRPLRYGQKRFVQIWALQASLRRPFPNLWPLQEIQNIVNFLFTLELRFTWCRAWLCYRKSSMKRWCCCLETWWRTSWIRIQISQSMVCPSSLRSTWGYMARSKTTSARKSWGWANKQKTSL